MNKNALYYVAAALWGIPGAIITIKGLKAYMSMPSHELWWLIAITGIVLICFFFMFRGAVDKYSGLIAAQPRKTSIFHTFPLRGWILIIFMLCLGISLKFHPRTAAGIHRLILFRARANAPVRCRQIHLQPLEITLPTMRHSRLYRKLWLTLLLIIPLQMMAAELGEAGKRLAALPGITGVETLKSTHFPEKYVFS